MPGRVTGGAVPEPPPGLDAGAAAVWVEVCGAHPRPSSIAGPELEAYCCAVAQLRDARARIAAEGAVVTGAKMEPVPHPALAVAREAAEAVRRWGSRFAPPDPARRRDGYMVEATRRAVAAAPHLAEERFAGAVAAVKTLAWLIDEAQRQGQAALAKAAFGTIPTYVKTCAELQITPAAVPQSAGPEKKRVSKLAVLRGGADGGASETG